MMRTVKFIAIILFLSCLKASMAQPVVYSKVVIDYIAKYKDIAIYEMLRVRIPASITLAQGILESKGGCSRLATEGHNHFGIKCKSSWTGKVILEDDDDFQECFRVYEDAYESYQDHSNFLINSNRYSQLFDLEITDYKGWADGLKKAGYATSPTYAVQLINLIEKYDLKQYDKITKSAVALKDTTEKHVVEASNGVSATKAQDHDTYTKIAVENKLKVSELLKFNDLTEVEDLRYGDLVYLKPKKRENSKYETHTMQSGESIHDVSQRYGIQLAVLLERNGLEPGEEPSKGEVITLNKKNKKEVKKRKVVKSGTQTVDMRIRMNERNESDSLLEAKYSTLANLNSKIDSTIAAMESQPVMDSLYFGNHSNATDEPEEKIDEVINNELFHYVRKGETLYSIAKAYMITIEEIKEWNKLTDTKIHLLQRLQVTNYYGVNTRKIKVFTTDEDGYYVVQEGDSLSEIGFNFGLTVDELLNLNNRLITDTLYEGDKFVVSYPKNSKVNRPLAYTVKEGDTLDSIAKKFEISVAEIKRLNSLKVNELKSGTKLFLQ